MPEVGVLVINFGIPALVHGLNTVVSPVGLIIDRKLVQSLVHPRSLNVLFQILEHIVLILLTWLGINQSSLQVAFCSFQIQCLDSALQIPDLCTDQL